MITVIGMENAVTLGGKNEVLVSLVFDKLAEITNLPTTSMSGVGDIAVHSMALCGETGKVYQLDGERDWVLFGGQ